MNQLTCLRIVHSGDVWRYTLLVVHAKKEEEKDVQLLFQLSVFFRLCSWLDA